ncbi:MAG: endonuclease/exonuclease/phosphatase family protein [Cyclobacteriaceae bacterium]|nr:endonuclease/exonuclease/phosphatase family protein [Cyclobacteriaceae bacterium]
MRFFMILVLATMLIGSLAAQTVKVMTYNLRLDTPDDGVNQWPKRTNKVVALITKYNPDIIGVQEALHHQLQDLLRMLPDYSYCGVGRDDGKEKGEYSAILFRNSRFGLLDTKTLWLSETMDIPGSKSWDAAITRVFTTARFFDRETKKEFVMVNTHFDHIGKVARASSAKIIKTYLAGLETAANTNNTTDKIEIPMIVSGDFNSEPTEEPYLNMVEQQGPLVLYDSRPASSTAGTFCGFKVGAMPCKTIDFVFHTKQWVARNYQVITDNDGTYYPSDHLPVLVDFDLALEK